MAGLTSTGLVINSQAQVIQNYKTQATAIFSDQVLPGDVVDVSDNSALGRIIGVVSPPLADVWAAIQQVSDSFNVNTATGISLDNMVALSGIQRLTAAPTRAQVVLEGNLGTTVASQTANVYSSITRRSYTLVSPVLLNTTAVSGIGITVGPVADNTVYTFSYTVDGISVVNTSITSTVGSTSASILAQLQTQIMAEISATFTTYYANGYLYIVRIDPFQTVNMSVSTNLLVIKVRKPGLVADTIPGPVAAPALSIDTVAIPQSGWDTVVNPVAGTTGNLLETDEELRERFSNSKFIQSSNILEALLDALRSVSGVVSAIIYENDTDFTDGLGVTPHAFMPIVLGGLSTDIGNAIWQNKPTGIGSIGNTTVQIADSQGYIHDISYEQPIQVPVYMNLDITSTGTMPGDVIAELRQDLVDFGVNNYLIGDTVIYSRLYTPINSIAGFQVNSFYIGTTASPTGTVNIPIAFNSVAFFDPNNINITIT
jgi:uncharacterized phage protein gp47/JayE